MPPANLRAECERVLRAWGEARRAAQVASHAFDAETCADDAAWNRAYDTWNAAGAASRIAGGEVERLADALAAPPVHEQPDAAGLYHGRRDVEPPGARAARSVRVPEAEQPDAATLADSLAAPPAPAEPAADPAARLGFTPHGRPRVTGESVRDVAGRAPEPYHPPTCACGDCAGGRT